MKEQIINHYSSNYKEVVNYLTNEVPNQKSIWYQKHMAHHLIDLSEINWIKNVKIAFYYGTQKEVISSYIVKNNLQKVEELGYPQQYEIAKFLKKTNKRFRVIDSEDLLKNPSKVLSDWCESINIDFDKSMLQWEKSHHQNDGIWWKHWYDNVINTTGFQKYHKKDINIENQYDSIYNESMEYYNYLKGIS